jgi:hypothetical protein
MTTKSTKSKTNNKSLQSTADAEILRLRMRLNKKREYIAILELELFNTRVALHEFMVIYQERISPLEQQVRNLRRKLYKILEAQREENEKPPTGFTPGNGFDQQGDPEEPEIKYEEQENGNGWRKVGKRKRKNHSPKMEEQIRDLFRELARRFHPDLTNDPEEKKWRQEVMTRVNQAYTNRDLKALRALAEQPDRAIDAPDQTKEQEVKALKLELKRLDGVIVDLKARIFHLEESPAWHLKMEARMKRRSGRNLLSEMEKKFLDQIADLEERLIILGVEIEEIQAARPAPSEGQFESAQAGD